MSGRKVLNKSIRSFISWFGCDMLRITMFKQIKNLNKKSLFGAFILQSQKILVRFRLKPYIFLSEPKLWRKGIYIPRNIKQKFYDETDVVIQYPYFLPKEDKKDFCNLANVLSKKHSVLVVEFSPEMGAGGSPDPTAYDFIGQIPPVIQFISRAAIAGLIENITWQALTKLIRNIKSRSEKNTLIIRRVSGDIRYNYKFESMDAETSIKAASLIPKEKDIKQGVRSLSRDGIYQDILLTYSKKDHAWIIQKD